MSLFLAANKALPEIPWNKDAPAFNTAALTGNEPIVRQHFSFPHVIYFGSDIGCGCGFRHSLIEGNDWMNLINEDDNSSVNHQGLIDFIKEHLKGHHRIEIYGCWAGDFSAQHEYETDIDLRDILYPGFFFKERGLYKVSIT